MPAKMPTADQLRDLRDNDDGRPFVMVNLVRFRQGGAPGESGKLLYKRYLAAADPLIRGAGGRVIWMGSVNQVFIGEPVDRWDRVLLVEYPSREAFLAMLASPEYQAVQQLREDGIESTVLMACRTSGGPA